MAWTIPVILWSAVLLVAAATALSTDGLDGADPAFFATCAQVGPVFGLAVFLEIAVVMAPLMRASTSSAPKPPETGGKTSAVTSEQRAVVALLVRANVGLLLISQGAALYATAAKENSGFLLLCTVLPWLLQLVLIVDAAYYRVGLSVIGRTRRVR